MTRAKEVQEKFKSEYNDMVSSVLGDISDLIKLARKRNDKYAINYLERAQELVDGTKEYRDKP